MKIQDIQEAATSAATVSGSFARTDSPYTSTQSVGKLEYKSQSNKVKLYRRNDENCPECVATITRKNKDGWRFNKTKKWDDHGLPHFGQLSNIKSDIRGSQTHRKHIRDVLGKWGIRYDDVQELDES